MNPEKAEPLVAKTTVDGKPALRFELRYDFPASVLWKHLTDPRKLKYWFPCEMDLLPRKGADVTFTFPGERPTKGMVLDAEKPRVLAYTWDREVLRWELEKDGDSGCLLTLTNTLPDLDGAGNSAAGWHFTLIGLDDLLHERPLGQNPADWERYVALYQEKFSD
ncbi:SRPBCC family protein [Arthrobacter sp. H20]|uniref:SRPBCC family protein n=1 Tax=Arthrobacter sp. H20 TaxID=1267981 RepID=UPI00138B1696|nr:SRPBCC family protein [Arthrobacter sp. H20]